MNIQFLEQATVVAIWLVWWVFVACGLICLFKIMKTILAKD
jgi:hypothetical protein